MLDCRQAENEIVALKGHDLNGMTCLDYKRALTLSFRSFVATGMAIMDGGPGMAQRIKINIKLNGHGEMHVLFLSGMGMGICWVPDPPPPLEAVSL